MVFRIQTTTEAEGIRCSRGYLQHSHPAKFEWNSETIPGGSKTNWLPSWLLGVLHNQFINANSLPPTYSSCKVWMNLVQRTSYSLGPFAKIWKNNPWWLTIPTIWAWAVVEVVVVVVVVVIVVVVQSSRSTQPTIHRHSSILIFILPPGCASGTLTTTGQGLHLSTPDLQGTELKTISKGNSHLSPEPSSKTKTKRNSSRLQEILSNFLWEFSVGERQSRSEGF
jgi:hypothetical protein